MESYYASLRGVYFDQLHGDFSDIPCTSIVMGERQRKLDPAKVAELADSIEKQGLLHPIGVRRARFNEENGYHLVYGAHRFAAWLGKFNQSDDPKNLQRWHEIPAVIFNREMSDDMALLLELSENVHRSDLTPDQRRIMASQVLELADKVEGKKGPKSKQGPKVPMGPWKPPLIKEAAKVSGIPFKTFQKWYTAYKNSTNGPDWNKQTEAQYKAFLAWLKAEGEREQARKKTEQKKKALAGEDRERAAFEAAAVRAAEHFPLDVLITIVTDACNGGVR